MSSVSRFVSLFLVAIAALPSYGQEGDREAAKPQFTRLARDEGGVPLALEAAIVRYAPPGGGSEGPVVDLVSAVHVAESSYFQDLNRRFQEYDVVLYELVAPEGTVVPKGGGKGSGSAVSMLQTTMTQVLELEFQLNDIDYTADNFVHADMTPKQFSESMQRRGETVFKIFFRMLGHAMSKQGGATSGGSDLRLLFALFDKNRAMALKRVLAEEFQDVEGSLTAIDGPDGSTLITERNKVALGVLREQIKAGHKKLAIFYGAGHMFDFEKRLRDEFALAPLETTWVTAWDLKGAEKSGKPTRKKNRAGKNRAGKDGRDRKGDEAQAVLAPAETVSAE
jgi:hypothetical protein